MTARSLKRLERAVTVTAKCIGCGETREIGPHEIELGDQPCCDTCGMPMIACAAHAKKSRGKGKGKAQKATRSLYDANGLKEYSGE